MHLGVGDFVILTFPKRDRVSGMAEMERGRTVRVPQRSTSRSRYFKWLPIVFKVAA
jgi:hypothetical protein